MTKQQNVTGQEATSYLQGFENAPYAWLLNILLFQHHTSFLTCTPVHNSIRECPKQPESKEFP